MVVRFEDYGLDAREVLFARALDAENRASVEVGDCVMEVSSSGGSLVTRPRSARVIGDTAAVSAAVSTTTSDLAAQINAEFPRHGVDLTMILRTASQATITKDPAEKQFQAPREGSSSAPFEINASMRRDWKRGSATGSVVLDSDLQSRCVLNAVLGTRTLSMGAQVAFASGTISAPDSALGLRFDDERAMASLSAVVDLNRKLTLNYIHSVGVRMRLAALGMYDSKTEEKSLQMGAEFTRAPGELFQSRIHSDGRIAFAYTNSFTHPTSSTQAKLIMAAEIDTFAIHQSPRVGIALVLC